MFIPQLNGGPMMKKPDLNVVPLVDSKKSSKEFPTEGFPSEVFSTEREGKRRKGFLARLFGRK